MFLKRGKRPSVVSGFQRAGYCRQASKPTTKDINDCCVLDLGKFPCVFQIIQYWFWLLTHVLPPHGIVIDVSRRRAFRCASRCPEEEKQAPAGFPTEAFVVNAFICRGTCGIQPPHSSC